MKRLDLLQVLLLILAGVVVTALVLRLRAERPPAVQPPPTAEASRSSQDPLRAYVMDVFARADSVHDRAEAYLTGFAAAEDTTGMAAATAELDAQVRADIDALDAGRELLPADSYAAILEAFLVYMDAPLALVGDADERARNGPAYVALMNDRRAELERFLNGLLGLF